MDLRKDDKEDGPEQRVKTRGGGKPKVAATDYGMSETILLSVSKTHDW
jgi:hypothetical protein